MRPTALMLAGLMSLLTFVAAASAQANDRTVEIILDDQGECAALFDSRSYPEPFVGSLAAELDGMGSVSPVTLIMSPDIQWRCVGGLVFVLQRRGFVASRIRSTERGMEIAMQQETAE